MHAPAPALDHASLWGRSKAFPSRLRRSLPDGRGLPEHAWHARHRWIVLLLWVHVPLLYLFGVYGGHDRVLTGAHFPAETPAHVLLEMVVLAAFAAAASLPGLPRRLRSLAASFGLVTASGLLVHFSGGYIEAHFHFFVMVGIIALYHDWIPFLLGIAYVALHHGIAGSLDPASVYNHPAAIEHPWRWAVVHAFFILGLSVAEIVHWRASERALAQTDLVLRSAGDGILGIAHDGRVAFANPVATRLIGREGAALVGRPWTSVPGPAAAAIRREATRAPEGAHVHDLRVEAEDGTVRYLAVTTMPMGFGEDAGQVITLKDLTESHQGQLELAARTRELAEAQRIAGIGSFVSDPRTGRVSLSPEMRFMLGLGPEATSLDRQTLLAAVHPEDRATIGAAVSHARQGGTSFVDVEIRVNTPTGDLRHLQVRGAPRADQGPEAERLFVGTARDVTEQRRAEEIRRVTLEQRREIEVLKERDAFKTRVLNAIAHELNTPLTPVKLQLHLLGTGATGDLTDRQRRSIELIGRNLLRFGRLVRDLLDAARIDGDQLRTEMEDVRLDVILQEAVENYAGQAEQVDVMLSLAPLPETWVHGDPQRLGQVIDNLVSNALKCTPRGGRIDVGAAVAGDRVQVWVEDTGPGLTPDEMRRLFQPFSQISGKARGVDEGTGLGLYVARAIVERHDGTIGCTSAGPGMGARFAFEVPLTAAASHPPGTARPSRTTDTAANDLLDGR